ncbi:MAG: hypothetical protein AAFW89_10035 [Bacteroidota bacterium]
MKQIRFIIYFNTAYLLLYTIFTTVPNFPFGVIALMFTASPFLVIYMVVKVLKDGKPSGKTWEGGYWYDDREKMSVTESPTKQAA